MALGASPNSVLWMVLRQGMTLIVVGLGLGIALAVSGTRLMQGLLFGIEPTRSVDTFRRDFVVADCGGDGVLRAGATGDVGGSAAGVAFGITVDEKFGVKLEVRYFVSTYKG